MKKMLRLRSALLGRVDLSEVRENLADSDPLVRVAALQMAVRQAGLRQAAPLLLELTEREQDERVRSALVREVTSRSWEPTSPEISRLLMWALQIVAKPSSPIVAIAPPPPAPSTPAEAEPLPTRRRSGLARPADAAPARTRPPRLTGPEPAVELATPAAVLSSSALSLLSEVVADERAADGAAPATAPARRPARTTRPARPAPTPHPSGPKRPVPPAPPAAPPTPADTRAGRRARRRGVLVTGVGGPAGLAVAAALLSADERLVVADASADAVGLRLFPEAHVLPASSEPDFVERLITLCVRTGCDSVISTVAEELVHLSPRADDLAAAGVSFMVSSPRSLERCLDKWKFFKALSAVDLPTADTQRAEHFDPATLPGPWVIKPRFGRGSRDIYFSDDPAVVPVLASLVPDALVQTRLPGREFTADCLSDAKGHPVGIVPRWRLATRGGISSAAETFADDHLRMLTAQLISELGLVGPSCVQGFVADDGTVAFTEINPRYSGGLSCSLASGADLVGQYLRELRGGAADLAALRYSAGVKTLRYFSDVDASSPLKVVARAR